MSILNEKTNETKIREVKNISCIYKTQGKTDTEKVNDIIIIGGLSHNTILKSVKITSNDNLSGGAVDLVLLNNEKNIIKYTNPSNTEVELNSLKSNISLATALENAEQLEKTFKFKTLEEHLLEETPYKNYGKQFFLGLRFKTAPTTATAGVKILTEVDFIEDI